MDGGGIDMPDITMCQYEECEKKFECYRYMAVISDFYQSYADFKNLCNKENGYDFFSKTRENDKLRNIERELDNGEKEENKRGTKEES